MPKVPDGLAERDGVPARDRDPGLARPETGAGSTDPLPQRQRRLAPSHPSAPAWDDGGHSAPEQPATLAGRPATVTDSARAVPTGESRPGHDAVRPGHDAVRPGHDAVRPGHDAVRAPAPSETGSAPAPREDDSGRVLTPREIQDRLGRARADGLATDDLYTVEPDREVWSKDRRALHNVIIDDLYGRAAGVPNERRAIIAGGLPGAGKTTVLDQQAGIDRSRYLTVNPDEIKTELARRGMVPHVEGLSPMEASDLVHEESSHIAKRLAFRAQGEGKNLIWDITMSSLESTRTRIQDLRDHGYDRVEAIFVDIPPEVSAARAAARHRDGEARYRAGQDYGGRFVAAEGILANADQVWGSSNRRTLEVIKPDVDAWTIYDNSADGRPAVLKDASAKETQT